jgi:hypothetical protein
MSTLFIKYTPDVAVADPGFDENLQTVIGKTERYIAQSATTEGTGRAVRGAHAKGYGLVRVEVKILDQLPAEYAQGVYATAGRHDALIRFSNENTCGCFRTGWVHSIGSVRSPTPTSGRILAMSLEMHQPVPSKR